MKNDPKSAAVVARWIAREDSGRELIVYDRTEDGARGKIADSKLMTTFVLLRAGHIDDEGRVHGDDTHVAVVDRRITS
jgi:hypothetical protein